LKFGSLIHFFDLLEEIVLGLISLEFKGRSENVILWSEGNISQVEDSRDLETMEAGSLGFSSNFALYEVDDLLIFQNRQVVSSNAIITSPFFENGLVWNNYCNKVALKRVTVDEDLCDILGLRYFALNLVRDYVLTLGQFENILLSVDDFKSTH